MNDERGTSENQEKKLESRFGIAFQLFFGVCILALGAAIPNIQLSWRVVIVLGLWWALLVLANAHAATAFFEAEKKFIRNIGKERGGKAAVVFRPFFVFLYWPVFLSKNASLFLLITTACAYYLLRNYYGE